MTRNSLVFSYFCDSLVVDAYQAEADTSRHTEEVVMAVAARKIEMEQRMNERKTVDEKVDELQRDVAVLKADVTHVQRDVSELKTDVKRVEAKLGDKFDALNSKLDERFGEANAKMEENVGALDAKMDARFSATNAKIDEKVGALDAKMDARFGANNAKMEERTGSLDEKINRVSADLSNHRVETEKSFGVVRQQISDLRVEMKDGFALLRREISGDRLKWVSIVIAAVAAASALGNYIGSLAHAPASDVSLNDREATRQANGIDSMTMAESAVR
jgi:chromosome segregation ATPase